MLLSESDLTQMAVYVSVSFLACCTYAIWDHHKNRDVLSPGVWVPLIYFFFYYNAAWLILIFGEENFQMWHITAWGNLPYSLKLNTLGVVGLLTGLSVIRRDSPLAQKLPDLMLRDRQHAQRFLHILLILNIPLFAINYLSYLDLIEFGFAMSAEQSQWLILTTAGTWFSCCLLEAALVLRRWHVFGLVVLANFALGLLALLGFATRHRVLFTILFLVTLTHYAVGFKFMRGAGAITGGDWVRKRLEGYRFSAASVLAMLLVLISVSIFKNVGGLGPDSVDFDSRPLKDHIVEVFWGLDYNAALTHEIDHYSEGEYEYGRTIVEGMLRKLTPVSLTGFYLFEPVQMQYQRYMEAKVGGGQSLGIGLDYSLNAEGFTNFGFLGVGVMMFLVGTIIRLFYVKYIVRRQVGQQGYSLIFPYLLFVCTPDIFRREFSNFGHLWFTMPLILWVLLMVATTLRVRRYNSEPLPVGTVQMGDICPGENVSRVLLTSIPYGRLDEPCRLQSSPGYDRFGEVSSPGNERRHLGLFLDGVATPHRHYRIGCQPRSRNVFARCMGLYGGCSRYACRTAKNRVGTAVRHRIYRLGSKKFGARRHYPGYCKERLTRSNIN
jgi:hypothetical protein